LQNWQHTISTISFPLPGKEKRRKWDWRGGEKRNEERGGRKNKEGEGRKGKEKEVEGKDGETEGDRTEGEGGRWGVEGEEREDSCRKM